MTRAQLIRAMIIDCLGVLAFLPFVVLGAYTNMFEVWLAGMTGFALFGILWWLNYGDRWWRP
jgi:hypothetical protein